LKIIDKFYKKLLRQIQALPDNVASEATYLLLGATPIEAQLHCRTLSLFGNICRLPKDHSLHQLAKRQLATQFKNKLSWFQHVSNLGDKYDINIHTALNMPDEKITWKNKTKKAILGSVTMDLTYSAACKTTLKWWIWPGYISTSAHQLWLCCNGKSSKIAAATVRSKMLVGRFKTEEEVKRMQSKAHKLNARCQLCHEEDEDILHIIARCQRLEEIRNPRVKLLQEIY
jgi:hypothetical protein